MIAEKSVVTRDAFLQVQGEWPGELGARAFGRGDSCSHAFGLLV